MSYVFFKLTCAISGTFRVATQRTLFSTRSNTLQFENIAMQTYTLKSSCAYTTPMNDDNTETQTTGKKVGLSMLVVVGRKSNGTPGIPSSSNCLNVSLNYIYV